MPAYKIAGAGNASTARNVIKVTFSEALTANPTLEAWDDEGLDSINKPLFVGTTVNGNLSLLSAIATTDSAPPTGWKPTSYTAGGATSNRLLGDSSYVDLSSSPPIANGSVTFNLCWELPSDFVVPPSELDDHNCMFVVKYSYSGDEPTLTWSVNSETDGGSEGSPFWLPVTPGIDGVILKPANAGSTSPALILTKPLTGVIDNPELWLVD